MSGRERTRSAAPRTIPMPTASPHESANPVAATAVRSRGSRRSRSPGPTTARKASPIEAVLHGGIGIAPAEHLRPDQDAQDDLEHDVRQRDAGQSRRERRQQCFRATTADEVSDGTAVGLAGRPGISPATGTRRRSSEQVSRSSGRPRPQIRKSSRWTTYGKPWPLVSVAAKIGQSGSRCW